MSGTGVQALLTVLIGSGALLWVARRARRAELRPPLFALLGFLVLWQGGHALAEASRAEAVDIFALHVSYLGACGLGPSWLFLAARFTRSRFFERQPGLLLAAYVPPAIAYLAFLTNGGHRLWATSLRASLEGPAVAWGGPVFWMALAWQLVIVLGGAVLFLIWASSSIARPQQVRARVIAAVSMISVGVTVAYYLDLLPVGFDPVPVTSAIAIGTIIAIAIRFRLLDFLPLARRDVIDAISDAVILSDAEGLILDLNPAARSLLEAGRSMRERPLARTLSRLVPEEEMSAAERDLEEALRSGKPATLSLRTRQERELEVQIGSVCDAGGEPTARFAVVRDLTEARRYERLLRESQQRVVVGGIAAGLAHEVNNPLAFVASNLHQVHRAVSFQPEELEALPPKRAEELAELSEVVAETIEGVERIASIVGRIIRPGTLSEEDLVRLDLGRVIEDAVRLVEFHGESTVRTHVAPMDRLPPIEGCPERLSQALLNLLLNARQAVGSVPDGSLFIEASSDRDGVAVELGIRDAEGESFRGALPSHTGTCPTSEAELSAAYETVREHGGTLESGSEPGVLFVLRLPAAA